MYPIRFVICPAIFPIMPNLFFYNFDEYLYELQYLPSVLTLEENFFLLRYHYGVGRGHF